MKRSILLSLIICFATLNNIVGQSWTPQNSGTGTYLTSVYFPSADTGYVSMEGGNIIKTFDGGQTWNMIGSGPWNYLFFINDLKGFGGGDQYILKTLNGGASWDTCYKDTTMYAITGIYFPDQIYGYATVISHDMVCYVLKTTNGGATWDTIHHDATMDEWYNCVFFSDSQHGVVGGSLGYIFKTSDGGANWSKIPLDTVNFSFVYSVFFPSQDTGYIATDMNGVYRTIDTGNTWQHLLYPIPPILNSIFFTDANHGCVVGGNGMGTMTLYQTDNAGNTWYPGDTGVQTMSCVFFPNSTTGYTVGQNGTILKYSIPVGITENPLPEFTVSLYPNPAVNDIVLDVSQKSEIEILNSRLQTIENTVAGKGHITIDISAYSAGVYFVKAKTDKVITVKKFIKE
jgi:photosystem II stability/assembly factor-like uncharacterized protein